MKPGAPSSEFFNQLEYALPKSNETQRRLWAKEIIENTIDLRELAKLLECGSKVATRFLWLLSDVGLADPKKLHAALPFLLKRCQVLKIDFSMSFASFWHYTGVPLKNEAEAIALLFEWLQSLTVNVTTKTRALWGLVKLCNKYPELKNELRFCLEDQMDKYSKDFKKRAQKNLLELEN